MPKKHKAVIAVITDYKTGKIIKTATFGAIDRDGNRKNAENWTKDFMRASVEKGTDLDYRAYYG